MTRCFIQTDVFFPPQRVQVLDVCAVLSSSMRRKRTILTVPWLVEFLSMLDFIGPLLLCYRKALGALLLLYRLVSSDSPKKTFSSAKMLLEPWLQ